MVSCCRLLRERQERRSEGKTRAQHGHKRESSTGELRKRSHQSSPSTPYKPARGAVDGRAFHDCGLRDAGARSCASGQCENFLRDPSLVSRPPSVLCMALYMVDSISAG